MMQCTLPILEIPRHSPYTTRFEYEVLVHTNFNYEESIISSTVHEMKNPCQEMQLHLRNFLSSRPSGIIQKEQIDELQKKSSIMKKNINQIMAILDSSIINSGFSGGVLR